MIKLTKPESKDVWKNLDNGEGVCLAGKKCIIILFSASEIDIERWRKCGYKKVTPKKAKELMTLYPELHGEVEL